MPLLMLHPGDLPLTFWLVLLLVMFVAALVFAVLLSLLLKLFLSRRGPARPARHRASERQS